MNSISISPKSADGRENIRGGGGQCLCSPTTHPGSFRCRFHRSMKPDWAMKRSNSMPITRRNNISTKSSSSSSSSTSSDTDHAHAAPATPASLSCFSPTPVDSN